VSPCSRTAIPKSSACRRRARTRETFVGYIADEREHRQRRLRAAGRAQSELDGTYVDPTDDTDAAQADALVDPFGLVFDSQTGTPINGARVRLVDVTTGPAGRGVRRRRRQPLPERNGHGPAGHRPGRHAVQPAGRRVPFPLVAPGNYRSK
jgi:hypothetical protein